MRRRRVVPKGGRTEVERVLRDEAGALQGGLELRGRRPLEAPLLHESVDEDLDAGEAAFALLLDLHPLQPAQDLVLPPHRDACSPLLMT